MSDKPADDQPVPRTPEAPSGGKDKAPTGEVPKHSDAEKADDREGQTREPGYDEA